MTRRFLKPAPVLLLSGRLDFIAAPALAGRIRGMVRANGLALDLSRVTYIDLSGLATLLAVDRNLRGRSRCLVILGPSACVRQALRLFGMTAGGPLSLEVRG